MHVWGWLCLCECVQVDGSVNTCVHFETVHAHMCVCVWHPPVLSASSPIINVHL